YDSAATCEEWLRVLHENLESDKDAINLLQEWCGYCLYKDNPAQRALFLTGEGANGKSVISAALQAMLGAENVSALSLELFGERFQLMQTLGKLVNIASEVGELRSVAEGQLKAFISNDTMSFEPKGKDHLCCRPTAKLMVMCNKLPEIADRSGGIWRRLMILPFER